MSKSRTTRNDAGLECAITAAGGLSAIARICGISVPAVSQWRRIPVERVLKIEKATGIPREALRPDIYPPEKAA